MREYDTIFEIGQKANQLQWALNDIKGIQADCEELSNKLTDTTRKDFLDCAIKIMGEAIDFVAEARDFVEFAVQGYRD